MDFIDTFAGYVDAADIVLTAVRETSLWTTAKIKEIRDLVETAAEIMISVATKIYTRELAELIFVKPYCRIDDVVSAGIAQRQSASFYLKSLADVGLLQETKVGREKIFINPELLRVLTGRQIGLRPSAEA